eukprot:1154121-Pelagomonas_calceolata.AAC.6
MGLEGFCCCCCCCCCCIALCCNCCKRLGCCAAPWAGLACCCCCCCCCAALFCSCCNKLGCCWGGALGDGCGAAAAGPADAAAAGAADGPGFKGVPFSKLSRAREAFRSALKGGIPGGGPAQYTGRHTAVCLYMGQAPHPGQHAYLHILACDVKGPCWMRDPPSLAARGAGAVPLAAAAAEAAVDEAGLIVGAAAVAPVGVEAGGGAPSPCSCFSSWSSVRAFAERRVDAAGPTRNHAGRAHNLSGI